LCQFSRGRPAEFPSVSSRKEQEGTGRSRKKKTLDIASHRSMICLVGCTDAPMPLAGSQIFQETQMFEYTFTKKVNAGTGIYKDGKEVKARKEVGKLPVMIPDFQDILSAVTAENADVLKRTEKGEPIANVFVSPEVQYIFDSVMEKTKARFAEFVTDDGSLSPKYVPWATLLDLSDPSFAKNIAEEFAALVKTHILSLGKSEALALRFRHEVRHVSSIFSA
jgi:hypothetical protein